MPLTATDPETVPECALWAALLQRDDIYCIAYRLCLGPEGSVDTWRRFVVWRAATELFWQAQPHGLQLERRDWEHWRDLQTSSRKKLKLLRKLLHRARASEEPIDGRH